MITLAVVKEALDTKFGRAAALVLAAGVAFGVWLFQHDRKVSAKAVAKIEKQDAAHVEKANAAGARSRDPRTRGLLDPHVRADD